MSAARPEPAVQVAHPERAREGGADRPLVQVAVGVLIRGEAFLLTSRPEGKVYAGYWEFPGGKLEEGETVQAALQRELHEELGIDIEDCIPWRTERFDYPHALVQLNFCQVTRWRGEIEMREGQSAAWQTLPVTVQPVLPGTVPVLQWMAQAQGFEGPTHPQP
ncbi:MAG: NUDIX domain-containing protein [Limnohabitans sp.]|jgi:8-oxo-dGTP diphosphatase|nr:NUDIX domain-containing protein [Betaproteobacteria bacterium]